MLHEIGLLLLDCLICAFYAVIINIHVLSENDASGKSDVDVLTVTENLVAELVNTEEDQQRQADLEPDEEPFEDTTEHSLVEVVAPSVFR